MRKPNIKDGCAMGRSDHVHSRGLETEHLLLLEIVLLKLDWNISCL
jgi:hypothetical protein